jgi:hypothetical protein
MTADQRRLDLSLSPLSIVAIGAAAACCAAISAMKLDHIYLLYAVGGFGLAAGFFQWRSRRRRVAQGSRPLRNTLSTQLFGLVFLTAVCSAPAIMIGRVLGGVDIWTGL